jgi:hypothetical protein
MYKQLLNKGFQPTYYNNCDLFEVTSCKTRLSYKLQINDKNLMKVILNVLDIFDKYFWLTDEECEGYNDIGFDLETDENLESFTLYIYNTDVDNFEMTKEQFQNVLSILPNNFKFEYLGC